MTEPTAAQVRAWARQAGLEVSERGRLPAALVQAYAQAQPVAAREAVPGPTSVHRAPVPGGDPGVHARRPSRRSATAPVVPVAARPVAARPVAARPVAARPVAARPVAARPVAARPVAGRPAAAAPVAAAPPSAGPDTGPPDAADTGPPDAADTRPPDADTPGSTARRSGRERLRTWPAWVIGAGAGVLLVAGGVSILRGGGQDVARSADGTITAAGRVEVAQLRKGDCVTAPGMERTEVAEVPVVPCADLHAAEVVALFDLPKGSFPGAQQAAKQAEDGCTSRLDTLVLSGPVERYALFYYSPTKGSWSAGDRSVQCLVQSAEPTRGSALR